MKLHRVVLRTALAWGLAFPGVALSAECDSDLSSADAGIAAGPREKVSLEAFEQAKALRAEAARLLAAGDDAACMKKVGEALELLKLSISE